MPSKDGYGRRRAERLEEGQCPKVCTCLKVCARVRCHRCGGCPCQQCDCGAVHDAVVRLGGRG